MSSHARHLLLILGFLAAPAIAGAQQLDLTISPLVVTFPTTDPDTAPVLARRR